MYFPFQFGFIFSFKMSIFKGLYLQWHPASRWPSYTIAPRQVHQYRGLPKLSPKHCGVVPWPNQRLERTKKSGGLGNRCFSFFPFFGYFLFGVLYLLMVVQAYCWISFCCRVFIHVWWDSFSQSEGVCWRDLVVGISGNMSITELTGCP